MPLSTGEKGGKAVTRFFVTKFAFLKETELERGLLCLTHIIYTWNSRRCKFCMVGSTTSRVDPATRNPLLQDRIVNCEIEHLIDFNSLPFKHLIKLQSKDQEHILEAWSVLRKFKVLWLGKSGCKCKDYRQSITFCACATVLGNPSRMKPFLHEGFFIASSIMPTTRSSETSSP